MADTEYIGIGPMPNTDKSIILSLLHIIFVIYCMSYKIPKNLRTFHSQAFKKKCVPILRYLVRTTLLRRSAGGIFINTYIVSWQTTGHTGTKYVHPWPLATGPHRFN